MKKMNESLQLVNVEKSMKIIDPSTTFIKRDRNEDRIKVLIVPEFGKKKLVTVHLPADYNCVVELLLVKLNQALEEKIEDIYLIANTINDVRYLVTLGPKQTFNKKITKKYYNRDLIQGRASRKKFHRNFFEFRYFRKNVHILLKYPLSPQENEFVIDVDDFQCLDEGQYLNDIIINFYLSYLTIDLLTSQNRKKISIFNTYFYTQLYTSNPVPTTRTYERVETYTQNVNLFEKEFVFVPIHHCAHWFLIVICYPGSIGTSRYTNTDESANENSKKENGPCMLIFDSKIGLPINRLEIVNELKSYLRHEYEVKTGRPNFVENDIPVKYADVPQQEDPSDCGVFLLHFVESFFREFLFENNFSKFENAKFKRWSDVDIVEKKRESLKRLIVRLAVRSQRCS